MRTRPAAEQCAAIRTDIGAFAVDAVDEELDRAHVVAGQQDPRGLLDAVLDQRERDEGAALLGEGAARLLLAVVRVEVDVAARLGHPVAGYLQQEEAARVRVDDVDEHRVAWVEAHLRAHSLEVRLGRVEAGDPPDARDPLGRVGGRVSAQRVSDQVHILGPQAVILHQILDQVRDFKSDQSGVRRGLSQEIGLKSGKGARSSGFT